MEVIVGTAGHIDHGKTALIKALTGVDADRLPEEKRRGITVDLGFAEMATGDVHLGFVDVPGHERFVKNMLAGASGIDVVMLVIDAGEGVMPQTREHFDICRMLDIKAGVVVITKIDLVDQETLELAKVDAAELVANSFLESAPTVCVSARTGKGIEDLTEAIRAVAEALPPREDKLTLRLPIDRSFSMKGFGTVVTGTLASGKIQEGAELDLIPTGERVRIRGLQTHGKVVSSAVAGQRVAVNLGGVDHSRIIRGMVLSEPGILRPTQIIDAEIEVLPGAAKPLRSRQRLRVHIGTIEALARIQILNASGEIAPGDKDLVQVRLETAVAAIPGERFILRRYSPQATIAGGTVIDAAAAKHRRRDFESVRQFLLDSSSAYGDLTEKVRILVNSAGTSGLSFSDLQARTALRSEILRAAINSTIAAEQVADAGSRYISLQAIESLSKAVESAIADLHRREPLARGVERETIREQIFAHLPAEIFQFVINTLESLVRIVADREMVRLASHKANLSPEEAALRENILGRFTNARLEVPKLDEALGEAIRGTKFSTQEARKFFQLFLDSGEIVKVTDEFYFAKTAINDLTDLLRTFASKTSGRLIDVAQFKDLAGVSRKYAIPLLEYFDRLHITSRAGNKRLIL